MRPSPRTRPSVWRWQRSPRKCRKVGCDGGGCRTLQGMWELMEADVLGWPARRAPRCGPPGGAARPGTRLGDIGRSLGAGVPFAGAGRRWVREVAIAPYELFSSTEVLDRMAMENILAGLAESRPQDDRRLPRGVGAGGTVLLALAKELERTHPVRRPVCVRGSTGRRLCSGWACRPAWPARCTRPTASSR